MSFHGAGSLSPSPLNSASSTSFAWSSSSAQVTYWRYSSRHHIFSCRRDKCVSSTVVATDSAFVNEYSGQQSCGLNIERRNESNNGPCAQRVQQNFNGRGISRKRETGVNPKSIRSVRLVGIHRIQYFGFPPSSIFSIHLIYWY